MIAKKIVIRLHIDDYLFILVRQGFPVLDIITRTNANYFFSIIRKK